MATRDEVAAVLYQMGTIYRDEIDDATVDAWVPTVSDISGSDLVRAAGEHARESRVFPRPRERRARAAAGGAHPGAATSRAPPRAGPKSSGSP